MGYSTWKWIFLKKFLGGHYCGTPSEKDHLLNDYGPRGQDKAEGLGGQRIIWPIYFLLLMQILYHNSMF